MDQNQLNAIGHEIRTQDNRITADPIFCVFQKERIYGVSGDYTDLFEMCNSDQQCNCDPDEPCGNLSDECKLVGYTEIDEFVNAHFTEKAANEHIRINGHNLKKPFVFVTSLWRCNEMIAIRNFLKSQGI